MTESKGQDKSCGLMCYMPLQMLLLFVYNPQSGPKALEPKDGLEMHNTIFTFVICHSWQFILSLPSCHSDDSKKGLRMYGKTKFLFLISALP